ncbi:MAG: hypothetical protein KME07_02340 [Pegethrix bostrychoides GSE-TBD4-15B]|uniref:Uncharacterized protein n=1 Tax=Pegethrix bostrychoides GSE-TBD4-15B TaxID=2839662 RepID=A0A951U367_9CYAN|nr:hypothetical protein [Pegethrix bostrychoides GSE-TBD4-15B]
MKTNQLSQFPLQLAQFTAQSASRLPQYLSQYLPQYLWLSRWPEKYSYRSLTRRLNRSKGWLLSGLGSLLLLWVFWQWLLALAVGLTAMLGVYLAEQGQLKSWRNWGFWRRFDRALSLAALAGLAAAGTVYLSLAIWLESDRSWLAMGVILEGLGLLAILSLLIWRQLDSPRSKTEAPVSPDSIAPDSIAPDYLGQLSAADPVQRLIAIRQLTQIVQRPKPPLAANHLSDCFRLMLDRETEPLLCHTLIESLQQLQPKPCLEPHLKPHLEPHRLENLD